MFSLSTIYLMTHFAIVITLVPMVIRRRDSGPAMAWILVILFLPWVGFILYAIIGENRLPAKRVRRHRRVQERLAEAPWKGRMDPAHLDVPLSRELTEGAALTERLGKMPVVGGNRADLLSQPQQVIDWIVADIDRARNHVHLAFYIFILDETGRRVVEALERAVQRGVTCRVLADFVGSKKTLKKLDAELTRIGAQFYPMLPVGMFRRHAARLDLRNHRKIVVVDGCVAYTGSQNMVNPGYGKKDLVWHDLMVRLAGPAVFQLQVVFLSDWYFETGDLLTTDELFPRPGAEGETPAQVLPSGPIYETQNYQRIVVTALYHARNSVTITTPYLIPDAPFLQAMEVAVLRGVQVDLIVPKRSDQVLVGAAGRGYYEPLMRAGVRLYLFGEGILHSKTMAVDDQLAFIGTSNFDIRSFALNQEVNLLLYGPEPTNALRAVQDAYRKQSEPLDPAEWSQRSAPRQLGQDLARTLSPLL